MSNYIEGKNVAILFDKGSGYVPHSCAVSLSIATNVELKDVMTVGDGAWRKPRQQRLGYSISLEGVQPIPLDAPTGYDTFNLQDNLIQFVNVAYRIYFESSHGTLGANVIKMIEGEAVVTESNLTAGAENLMDSSFTLEGFGAYEMFDSVTACNATLSTFTYSGQSPVFVALEYSGLAGGDRLEYSVDGSTRRAVVDAEPSGEITIVSGVGMIAGGHTVVLWPKCANGEDGTSLTLNYTKT